MGRTKGDVALIDKLSSLSATLNGFADFTNAYGYDALDRVTQLSQSGAGVSIKNASFAYNADGQMTQLDRYALADDNGLVAQSAYAYDADSRLISLAETNYLGAPINTYGPENGTTLNFQSGRRASIGKCRVVPVSCPRTTRTGSSRNWTATPWPTTMASWPKARMRTMRTAV